MERSLILDVNRIRIYLLKLKLHIHSIRCKKLFLFNKSLYIIKNKLYDNLIVKELVRC